MRIFRFSEDTSLALVCALGSTLLALGFALVSCLALPDLITPTFHAQCFSGEEVRYESEVTILEGKTWRWKLKETLSGKTVQTDLPCLFVEGKK